MVLYLRMILDAAGVDRMPSFPMMKPETPLAEPILRMIWTASGEKYRPSPPMTIVDPFASMESKMD